MKTMTKLMLAATVAISGISAATTANAALVTYTFSGVFDGTINGQGFSNSQATFTGIGDTDNAFFQQDANFVPLSSFTAVSGGTTYDFGAGFNFWSSQSFGTSGFKTGDDFIAFTGLGNYANPSNLAPTPVSVYFYATQPFASSQGAVVITNATQTSFSASVAAVPETATWGMMILGFGMIGAASRSRKVKTTVTFA